MTYTAFPFYLALASEDRWRNSHISEKSLWFRHTMEAWFPTVAAFCQIGAEVSEGEYIMAAKKDFGTWHMVACRLSESQGRQFRIWQEEYSEKGLEPVSELVAKGLKISITWVDQSNSFVVSVTNTVAKQTLSSWSDDWDEALWMSLYKVVVIYDNGDWFDLEQSSWG